MKIFITIMNFLIGLCLFLYNIICYAATPLWTFTPLTATTIRLPIDNTAIIQYQVTNKSKKSHTLVMTPLVGINQTTTSGNCPSPFSLGYLESCILTLTADGSKMVGNIKGGPNVCELGNALQCYRPSLPDSLNITLYTPIASLSASVATLALSVTGLNEYGIPTGSFTPSGLPRKITITNTGTHTALDVGYNLSPSLPTGSSISPASCGNLAPSATCVLTITPGATPSAASADLNPIPIILSIAGSNTNTLTPTINILTYGSFYQSGYIYAFDDYNTPDTGSVGGKVVTTSDQVTPISPGIVWSSNSSGNVVFNKIYAITEVSTTSSPVPSSGQVAGQVACNGAIDGSCDTNNIYVYYQTAAAGAPINLSYYATGLCKQTIDGYSDWFLPAICEMGYTNGGFGLNCGTSSVPKLQNMQSNLMDYNNLNLFPNFSFYWSSTTDSQSGTEGEINAFGQVFAINNQSIQGQFNKNSKNGVRCSRFIT